MDSGYGRMGLYGSPSAVVSRSDRDVVHAVALFDVDAPKLRYLARAGAG